MTLVASSRIECRNLAVEAVELVDWRYAPPGHSAASLELYARYAFREFYSTSPAKQWSTNCR